VQPAKRPLDPFGAGEEREPLALVSRRPPGAERRGRGLRELGEILGVDAREGLCGVVVRDVAGEKRALGRGAVDGLGLLPERVTRESPRAPAPRRGEEQDEGG
jgi:hypothetical protein